MEQQRQVVRCLKALATTVREVLEEFTNEMDHWLDDNPPGPQTVHVGTVERKPESAMPMQENGKTKGYAANIARPAKENTQEARQEWVESVTAGWPDRYRQLIDRASGDSEAELIRQDNAVRAAVQQFLVAGDVNNPPDLSDYDPMLIVFDA